MDLNLITHEWGACLDKTIDPEGVPTLSCLWVVLQNIINVFTTLAGIIALILIIYSGIKFIRSGGDKERIESARKTLTFAIIGLIFIMFAFFIIIIISNITGVSVITLTTPPQPTPLPPHP